MAVMEHARDMNSSWTTSTQGRSRRVGAHRPDWDPSSSNGSQAHRLQVATERRAAGRLIESRRPTGAREAAAAMIDCTRRVRSPYVMRLHLYGAREDEHAAA